MKYNAEEKRNLDLENILGNLMIVNNQIIRLQERVDQSMPSSNSYEDNLNSYFSFKYVKSRNNPDIPPDIPPVYYNVSLKVTQSEEPAYNLGDRDRNAEFENIMGNLFIAKYQQGILQKRALAEYNASYLSSQYPNKPVSSEFIFEPNDNTWLKVDLNVDKAKMPKIELDKLPTAGRKSNKKKITTYDEYIRALNTQMDDDNDNNIVSP